MPICAGFPDALPAKGQDWTLVEHDPALIQPVRRSWQAHRSAGAITELDLAADLETLAEADADIITASALLDLVSAEWLDRLVAWRRSSRAALYIALSYDGLHGLGSHR